MVYRFTRRRIVTRGLATLCLAVPCASLRADSYPERPVRIVVPYPAGGPLDVVARALGLGLSKRLGQPVIVDNKPGGNGLIATQFVSVAKPDGYTLYLSLTTPYSMLPALYRRPIGYDAEKDRTDIALVAAVQSVFVASPRSGIKTLREYIQRAKIQPGALTYASTGTAQIYTLATELLKSRAKLDILQIPFQGVAPAVLAVASGEVDSAMLDVGTATPQIRAGRLTPLFVLGQNRVPALPGVPTLEEEGLRDLNLPLVWMGMVGPGGLPTHIVTRLNTEINNELRGVEFSSILTRQSLTAIGGVPSQMQEQITSDILTWSDVIKRLNIRLDE